MTEFTAKDKWEAAKREVGYRKHVYARRVADDYAPAAEAIIHAERTRQGTLL